MTESDDAELVARARAKDAAAFGQLVKRHEGRIFACAFKMMGQRNDAEDVVQDVFLRAYRALDRFDGRSELSTWLYRICINVCLNRFRNGKRAKTVIDADLASDALDAPASGEPRADNPEQRLQEQQRLERLAAALDGLSPALRSTVVLVLMQGLPRKQACEVLGCSEGTIAWRIHEARRQLRVALESVPSSAAKASTASQPRGSA